MALSPTRSRFTLSSLADDLGPVIVTADAGDANSDDGEAQPQTATRVPGRPVLVRVRSSAAPPRASLRHP